MRFSFRRRGRCRCGHGRDVHAHYRRGSDCASCLCRKWRRATRLGNLIAEWDEETEAEYRHWLAFLASDGDTEEAPGPGMAGWTTLDARCRDYSADAPVFRHVPGCCCLVTITIAEDEKRGRP